MNWHYKVECKLYDVVRRGGSVTTDTVLCCVQWCLYLCGPYRALNYQAVVILLCGVLVYQGRADLHQYSTCTPVLVVEC